MERLFNHIISQLYQLASPHLERCYIHSFLTKQRALLVSVNRYLAFELGDFEVLVTYLDRLRASHTTFINHTNISYILLALIILYTKMYDDTYYKNSFYAGWTQVNLTILNRIEWDIFKTISLWVGGAPRPP